MNHQQHNNNSEVSESITTQEAVDLLFGEDGLMKLFASKMKQIALLMLAWIGVIHYHL
jgi:hypothetical protein